MNALELEALSVTRGDREVLRGLSLRCEAGVILHVVGANGAGKTSLLEVIAGLRAAAAGRLRDMPQAHERHWIGHRNAVHPALSVMENLSFWCRLQGMAVPSAAIDGAIDRVGLRRQRHRACGRLSMGQRRRTALARLLALPRSWWLLDEPLAGLDAAGIVLVADLLDQHARGGGAAVVSSHQPFPAAITGLRVLELR
ncbi:MAG: heme ABC exporter ATP-binding protein CcmA [Gammaproteobacteria bacterium]|nr:heme ABC exporter ATP-binding protein CcmA [Gammaproteobacteria bacterium]